MKKLPFIILLLGILAVTLVAIGRMPSNKTMPKAPPAPQAAPIAETPPPPAPGCYVYMSPDDLERRGDTIPPPGYRTMEQYRDNWYREVPYPKKDSAQTQVTPEKKASLVITPKRCHRRHHRCHPRLSMTTNHRHHVVAAHKCRWAPSSTVNKCAS